jgi:hypothetical protein
MVLNIKSNDELSAMDLEEKNKKAELEKAAGNEVMASSLLQFVRARWERSLRAKRIIEIQMIKNIRQALGQYEPSKLSAIKKMGGSDVFIGITGVKCRHALAWIEDTLTQPNGRPWAIEPTPDVEIPPEMMEGINASFVRAAMMKVMSAAEASGQQIDVTEVTGAIRQKLPSLKADISQMARDKAIEKAADMTKAIDDQLVEGGWYQALSDVIFDLVVVKNAFIKGPVKKMVPVRVFEGDEVVVKNKVKRVWSRTSPFDIYPEPDSSGINDGYLFEHIAYRRKDLTALLGVEDYNDSEIRAVLREQASGGLRDWTGIETQRAELEGRDVTSVYDSEKIDGLVHYGSAPGSVLLSFGMDPASIPDPDIEYDVVIYVIGRHIIKAVINEDPYGLKPYSSAGYDMQPDRFWHRPLPEGLVDSQSICNAAARALVNNVGMGSGPQVEINIDRLSPLMKGDVNLIPWKKWLTTNKMMQSGKAIEFWQPNMHAAELIEAYRTFSRVADEHSVPAYAHGDTQVGGAGNTASGLSMLITQASRGIKKVIKNCDDFLIIPSIVGIYNELALDPRFKDRIGDLNLVAKGSVSLIEKEQRAVRMLEFLSVTNNAIDTQLTGAEGRGYLLEEAAKAHQIDPNKALAGLKKMKTSEGMGNDMNPNPKIPGAYTPPGMDGTVGGGGSAPSPVKLDETGNPVQGTSNQLFNEGGGHPVVPTG